MNARSEKDPPKVLLVEDNPVNQKLAEILFRSLGYPLQVATTAEEALALLSTQVYPFIFMDIQLPGMDGLEATRRLRKQVAHKDTQVIALTAGGYQDDHKKYRQAGIDRMLQKPLNKTALLQILDPGNHLPQGEAN